MPLTSSPEQPQPLREVVRLLKGWVERTGPVWVEGQVIQLKRRAGSSIHFLTLRDKLADVSVQVSASTAVLDAAGPITEGTLVSAHLKAQVYPGNGSLTFACNDLRPSGEGRLLAHLEQRKRALQAEGLFARDLKQRLPFLPRAIGLVTAHESAAERDVVENVRRRWPGAVVVPRYALVQGLQAVEQVTDALRWLDAQPEVDVIVIARGGGSLEDLLPFSDEGLVRAVAAARTPVVSAIGHESDNPILDLVADVRASTPTDAAKRVVPDVVEERTRIASVSARLDHLVDALLARQQEGLRALRSRPVLVDPTGSFAIHDAQVAEARGRALRAVSALVERESVAVGHHLARVRAMSPKATLERGYAIVVGPEGHALTSVADADPGDDLLAYLADGQLAVEVRDVRPGRSAA